MPLQLHGSFCIVPRGDRKSGQGVESAGRTRAAPVIGVWRDIGDSGLLRRDVRGGWFCGGGQLPTLFTRFPANPAAGAAAGKLNVPRALATDPRTGDLLVAEIENRRVSEFTPWGAFVKAFGAGVATGPVDGLQEVRIRATGGQFRLSFGGEATPDLSFDASGAAVEAALNSLPSIMAGGGSVSVQSSPGNQVPGTTPSIYAVTFSGGALAGTDVGSLVAEQGATPLSGGEPTSSLEVVTEVNGDGTSSSGVCTAESGCMSGTSGAESGELREPEGVAVDQAGNVYVMDPGNARVQKFSPEGEPLLVFGGEVDETTGADICTVASGDECGAGVEGSGPGFFERTRSSLGQPQGVGNTIDVDASGRVFVGDHNRIQEFDADGAYGGEIDLADLNAQDPSVPAEGYVAALTVDRAGRKVYFTDYVQNRGESPPRRYSASIRRAGPTPSRKSTLPLHSFRPQVAPKLFRSMAKATSSLVSPKGKARVA